eukprot:TRINITY_DN3182_c0_g1_i1.p1 TRINITY_DN3182_c0_g1~~TRINITY_DN3182_c0_g1_i1.p1  ORF type:complete len:818 (+),score=193.10 TRINITY_DN3182_c0_g1_i1:87-2540(+)
MVTTGSDFGPNQSVRALKVETIFKRFDRNEDGRLNREEMASLVVAVNPKVKFSDEQISAILDEVFRTYGEFIDSDKGLSLDGLRRTYDDGAGDVDRDFDALGLTLPEAPPSTTPPAETSSIADDMRAGGDGRSRHQTSVSNIPQTGSEGPQFESTWKLLDDLQILLKRHEKTLPDGNDVMPPTSPTSAAALAAQVLSEGTSDPQVLAKGLADLRQRADSSSTPEQAFDAHMSMGQMLMDHKRPDEALLSFRRAVASRPYDVRAHFRHGNALYMQAKYNDACDAYGKGLEAGKANPNVYVTLLPQVHVNMGISLEGEGMLMSACEHYREAAIMNPNHFRALKLLGSALYGLGEYSAAEEALEHSLFLKPDYADAYCDLGSTLHAQGEDEKARKSFENAIRLRPGHVAALYNLGGLLRDTNQFQEAANTYDKVLSTKPDHWRSQLNKSVALLGAGKAEEAKKNLKEAFKMTNRVELYDAIKHLKRLSKKNKGLSAVLANMPENEAWQNDGELANGGAATVIDASRFKRAANKCTPRTDLGAALEIRAFQRLTRLVRCPVKSLLAEQTNSNLIPGATDKMVRKAALEKILRRLLNFLTAETFQGAVRAVNERILSVLDTQSRGSVDLAMFLAVVSPLCQGLPEERKRVAFEALVWRGGRSQGQEVIRSDAKKYFHMLQAVYHPVGDGVRPEPEDDRTAVTFREFNEMFENAQTGFPLMDVLLKLEHSDRIRHNSLTCSVCAYSIIGLRYREVHVHFNLCSMCYSEGKVPAQYKREDYVFKEFSTETSGSFDKLFNFGTKSNQSSSSGQSGSRGAVPVNVH